MKYRIDFTKPYIRRQNKLFKGNPQLCQRLHQVIRIMGNDPFHPSLRTHRAETRKYGVRWSSRVTGDIRIIWDFTSESRTRILAIDIGGHSGKRKVYN